MAIVPLILGLALGTFALKLVPLTLLSRAALPAWLEDWLRLVPGAVLAASLAQALLVHEERLALSWHNTYVLAALPTFLVAWRSRNMILTMLTGIVSYALLLRLPF